MTEEINFETTKRVSFYAALYQGIAEFFRHFVEICKLAKPIGMIALGVIISMCSVLFASMSIYITITLAFLGICMVIYWFWPFLLGIVAVSYFAKDVYTKRPVQSLPDYYEFVKEHSKSYIKYLLWIFAIYTLLFVLAVICFFNLGLIVTHLYDMLGFAISMMILTAVAFILLIPFGNGIALSLINWAYTDKTFPLKSIINAVKLAYRPRNIVPLTLFYIVLNIVVTVFSYGISGLTFGKTDLSESILTQEGAIWFLISIVIQMFLTYFTTFVSTRYYFELYKE